MGRDSLGLRNYQLSGGENDRNFIGYPSRQNHGPGLDHHLSPSHWDLGPGLARGRGGGCEFPMATP